MKNITIIFSLLALTVGFSSCDPDPIEVDLEVSDITFDVTGIDTDLQDFEGTVVITATVTNLGPDNYESGANQQGLILQESGNGTMLGWTTEASVNFGDLAVGETVTATYTRTWDISSPAEGEFPPYYKAYISFDPDIKIDGNESNDDENTSNDELIESGEQINNMF